MISRTAIKWVALALIGLVIAAGVSIAASRLASQQIGLASEPIEAGDALAPAAAPRQRRGSPPRKQRPREGGAPVTPAAPTPTGPAQQPAITPEPSPPAEPSPPIESPPQEGDDGGGGGEHGGGRADD